MSKLQHGLGVRVRGTFRLLAAAFLLAVTAPACGTSGADLCDEWCDCDGCSNREYDDCLDHYDNYERDADRRGCLDYYDDYLACQDDTWDCRDHYWDDGCGYERKRLNECID